MNDHENKKKKIKTVGLVLVIVGGIFTAIGLISFFSAFAGNGFPSLFWCCFVGMPLLGFGGTLLSVGYRRETMKYMKDEGMPIYKETYQDLKPEVEDFVSIIKDEEEKCPHCGKENDKGSKYCKHCGKIMNKVCPHCNSIVDGDALYCSQCGKKID